MARTLASASGRVSQYLKNHCGLIMLNDSSLEILSTASFYAASDAVSSWLSRLKWDDSDTER